MGDNKGADDINSNSDPPEAKRCKLDTDNYLDDPSLIEAGAGEIPEPKFTFLTMYEGEFAYTFLNDTEVAVSMNECIAEVESVLVLPIKTIRQLLSHFKWDKYRLYEKYYGGDAQKFMKEIGLVEPTVITAQPPTECDLCCLEMPSTEFYSLACGHPHCKTCWGKYLQECIHEGKSVQIECPEFKCSEFIDDRTVLEIVMDEAVIIKYNQLLTKDYVQNNSNLRWCPSPNCNFVARVVNVNEKPVRCPCNTYYCFKCGDNWHGPLRCALMKKWKQKCDDDSETSNWFAAHTNDCPKCNSPIEKNGGCNHISCKKCGHHFCWVCLGAWSAHKDAYNCNRYNEQASEKKETSRKTLERYLFYANRYLNHINSLKFEKRLCEKMEIKMDELCQKENMSHFETLFLKEAVRVLNDCRQVLLCTYAFAYYLEKTNPAMVFEDNQRDLEVATERLSHCLEVDIYNLELSAIKPKVLELYPYCDLRRQALLNYAYEGYENNMWTFYE